MYNVKVTFNSGRIIDTKATDFKWSDNTLVIYNEDGLVINVSLYTSETIEIKSK